MFLWRLKLVGFINVPMRCRKDVTNRSVLFTYQFWRHGDVLAWSAASRPIWDLNETSLRRSMTCGQCVYCIFEKVAKYLTELLIIRDHFFITYKWYFRYAGSFVLHEMLSGFPKYLFFGYINHYDLLYLALYCFLFLSCIFYHILKGSTFIQR